MEKKWKKNKINNNFHGMSLFLKAFMVLERLSNNRVLIKISNGRKSSPVCFTSTCVQLNCLFVCLLGVLTVNMDTCNFTWAFTGGNKQTYIFSTYPSRDSNRNSQYISVMII